MTTQIANSISAPKSQSTDPPRFGGVVQHYCWTYQNQAVSITYETLGEGSTVLLLPAFSTVSTRAELAKITEILAQHFRVIALDWLGFGDSERPAFPYGRSLYQQLLKDFVQACCPQTAGILAAGHAAGYALHLVQSSPTSCDKLLLVAPTWKGPLRAMGAPDWLRATVRNLVRSPILGQALYGLNTKPAFLKWMYQRHVFADETLLSPSFIAQRHRITQQPGARFAPAAFVTGALDPMANREEWLQIGTDVTESSGSNGSVTVILAEKAPPQSTAEMQALAALPQIHRHSLPGSLGLYEEYGAEVGTIAASFFKKR